MRYNLLKMTQLILSSMESDEINSIGDTVEAQQVVDIIETTYYDICSQIDFPDSWDFFELDPSLDASKPTVLRLPDNVAKMEWLKYNISDDPNVREYRTINPIERTDFFDRMNSLDVADERVFQYDYKVGDMTFDVRGYNDNDPVYYTVTNDRTVFFDSYVADREHTIVANKTQCYGMIIPQFLREDSYTPDLEPRHFTLLFNEAKSLAFNDLKQIQNAKAEQRARRGWTSAHRKSPQTGDAGRVHWDYTWNFGRNVRGRR
jgi:hypothetical protein